MKKIIQKIAGLALGLSLAVGVGVALSSKKADPVHAAEVTITYTNCGWTSTGGEQSGTVSGITVSTPNGAINTSNKDFRVYKNSTLTVSSSVGDISSLAFTYSGSNNGGWSTSYSPNASSWTSNAATGTQARITNLVVTVSGGSTPVTYTVTYDPNGGTGEMEDTVGESPKVAECGFTAPSGKQFDRWNTQANGNGTDYTVGQQVAADLDLFAIWKDQSSSVTLDKIGTNAVTAYSSSISTIDITDGSNTYTLNYVNAKKQNDAMIMQKSSGAFISNKTVMPGNISSIELFINSGASGSATYDVAFSKTELTTATAGIGAVNITGGNSHEYANSSVSGAKYFCITLGAAYNGQVLKIVINYESVDPSLKTMVIKQSGTAAEGGSYAYKASGTYTFEAYEESTKVTGVTWSVSDSEVATINTSSGALTTVKPGSLVVTAKAEGYNDATASIEITKGTVSSVSVTGNMTKTAYFVGESWSNAGLTARATYSSGWIEDVTGAATWSYNPASPALNVESVIATATLGGKSGSSSSQTVSVSRANPIQLLYTKSSGASVDVYGYYVGFLDGTGPVIMDGDYGIVIYNKTADVSSYTVNETILHVTGSISIYNGLYEIGSATINVASGTFNVPDEPIVYSTSGNETAEYANRLTTVTGVPSMPSGKTFPTTAGSSDVTINFQVGTNNVSVFYKKAAQTADAEAFAAIADAISNSAEITIKGFTGWYNGFQVQMNGYVPAVDTYTAEDFSQDLIDQTDAVCEGYKEGDNNHDALVAIWSNLASNDKYPSLPSDQKTILAEAERDEEGTIIEQAMARYDFLTGKYKLNNFINGRTPINTSGSTAYLPATDTNSSTIIVVIVAITSITSIGVLLVIKKRRVHQ